MSHGTIAAYWRHHRSGSTPCPACKKAWSQYVSERRKLNKPARPSNFVNTETKAMDRLLAEKPPRITWRKKSNGIWVHTSINDPHADTGYEARLERELSVRAAMEDEAREVAERFRKHRAENTRLMQAARTEI